MKAKELISALDKPITARGFEDFEVKGISCNSKEISDGFIFVAIEGTRLDGRQFIEEAIEKGAKAIIVTRHKSQDTSKRAAFIQVKDARGALARLAAGFYGYPSSKIKVAGITGTNGKTTITYLLEALLKSSGFKPAVIGTINYRLKNKILPSRNTTPGAVELQSFLKEMVKSKLTHAIMEVSSHALSQDRTADIDFHSAIFTNLTQDHLDYHRTFADYFLAKSKLFKSLGRDAFAVINIDDKYGRRLKGMVKGRRVITYAIENDADVRAGDIELGILGTEFDLKLLKENIRLKTRLIGRHNVYNVLAACAWALGERLPREALESVFEKFYSVPGRLERIRCDKGFSVFVDYAHTDDALTNVISSLRQVSEGRIIVVFGCGGERDKGKRPKMGRAASELADRVIITSDNPRSEDPEEIINGVIKGIKKDNYRVIFDREKAIRESLFLAKKGDIVLIAGKGHENYQVLKGKTVYFNDSKVARECLRSMN
ncbi:MAG: UDP-N-acetylmuramoyl-L-alanyl-D-glutamate--2,6-diaminopimelate ligase [Candidatus Omnitrophica bacterium]|nr:UDP-N-acetylmuramoyl-L-alanyl-D-glutamate--2,6-diaminopimelate ligase [Candidatus Omnitrophota bacterium]MDD5552932.1 UDP-N-acetylmuramoyl-L-alanyl-D-glutamate--2,6-diaminopimelate ligase [Candidatus Omnitrophota bacterium]